MISSKDTLTGKSRQTDNAVSQVRILNFSKFSENNSFVARS